MMGTSIRIAELLARASQSAEAGDLVAAESSLKQAIELDPKNLIVRYQAARFYAEVAHDSVRAREHARLAKEGAAGISREMDAILGDGAPKRPASRHIGGIIGPY